MPEVVAYCHCGDCKRWTGAPLPAFAAFAPSVLSFSPTMGEAVSHAKGVDRWFCRDCGSALAARFDYLPDQLYVPLGIVDQSADLPPTLHAHAESALTWLHLADGAERVEGSSRAQLRAAK